MQTNTKWKLHGGKIHDDTIASHFDYGLSRVGASFRRSGHWADERECTHQTLLGDKKNLGRGKERRDVGD